MKTLTEQEIFDTVATHLLTQNAKAEIGDGNHVCQYHAPDGRRCAVGCLIPPDVDTTAFNSQGLYYAYTAAPELFRDLGITGGVLPLLGQLQEVHDGCSVVQWPRELLAVAEHNGLQPSLDLLKACDRERA